VLSPQSVLVVDDEREISFATCLRLQRAGYTTRAAADAEAGLQMAKQQRPDVIVLDMRLPGMDGLTALRELKSGQDTRDIPVIILSASLPERNAALDAGARFYLTKPYHCDEFLAAVRVALEQDLRGAEDAA
jgi:DNA-binding response OmpR family regulator